MKTIFSFSALKIIQGDFPCIINYAYKLFIGKQHLDRPNHMG
jgi:hypothetical protein